MNENESVAKFQKTEKRFLKKQLKQLFTYYLDTAYADDLKDRQNKLYAYKELKKLLKT